MRVRALAVLVLLALSAGGSERGLPLVRAYLPEEFHAGSQTFGVGQDGRGVLYFANLKGALVYDGAWWNVIELPNRSAVFALERDSAGRMIAGGVEEIGVIEGNRFRPLPAGRSIGDVNSICREGDGFIAVTDRVILAGNATSIRVIDATPREHQRCFRANEATYIATAGLLRVDGDRLTTIIPALDFEAVVSAGPGRLLAMIHGKGLCAIENGAAVPLTTDGAAWLKEKRAADVDRLLDGRIAITTPEDGVAILTPDGKLDQVVDRAAGVPDDVIRAAFVDREGSLWLAASDGSIAQIDLASPLTVWDSRLGIRGAARQMFRWNGRLYLTNSHGVFAIDRERTPVRRVLPANTGPAWFMTEVPEGLMVTTSTGILLLDRDEHPTLIAGTDHTGGYGLIRPSANPSLMYFGSRKGLGVMRRDASGWKLDRMIDGSPPYVRDLFEEKGVLWAGTTFNGALRIDDPGTDHPRLTRLGKGEMHENIVDGRVGFVYVEGAHFYRPDGNRLVEDPAIKRLHIPSGYFRAAQDVHGNLWLNTIPPRVYRALPGGGWETEGEPLVSVAVTDIQQITCDADGVVWLGSNRGMYRYDSNAGAKPLPPPPPLIHRIDAVGTARDGRTLRHDFRRLRIEFAPVAYHSGMTFQYRLDPTDSDWSPWSNETFVDFTNLSGGEYTFRVRARGPEGSISPETHWAFAVLPPWYSTRTSFVLWVVALAAAIVLIVRIRTRALSRQAERLRASIGERTQELGEKNELLEQANARLERLSFFDELTGIANRRYFQRLIAEDWQNAMRDRSSLAMIMIDLDHFKDLNDTRGHPAGDEALRRVGELLGSTIRRSGDVAARYGGEEFAVLLVGASENAALQIAERLRIGIFEMGIAYDGSGTRFLTASCGVAAMIPNARGVPDTLIEHADQALYAAKNAGRDCVKVASMMSVVNEAQA
jgi:diguanylate cyclase (GGDEF)-like protein